MSKINYADLTYTVNGREGYQLTEALRLWKTKYINDFKDFEKDVITHERLHDFRDFVKEVWDSVEPVTIEDAFKQANTEARRTYFDAIGIQKIFKELGPELKDRQVIKKKRTRWDDKNTEYEYEFEDIYELYQIDGKKLFGSDKWGNSANPVFAVRCWCTTTNREYWLYVSIEAATGQRWWSVSSTPKYDAIQAIAWTIRLDISDPERIYRQGDIIVAKKSDKSKDVNPYHLNKEQYLKLMYSET